MTNLIFSAILTGHILVHDAFPGIFERFPERQDPGVQGYVAVNDCGELGERYVLVRRDLPDVLVAVADCAWRHDVAWREANGYIADVGAAIWQGPWRPQYAELWPVAARAEYWASFVPPARPGQAVLM